MDCSWLLQAGLRRLSRQWGSLTRWWKPGVKLTVNLSQHELSRIRYKALAGQPVLEDTLYCTKRCMQIMKCITIISMVFPCQVEHVTDVLHRRRTYMQSSIAEHTVHRTHGTENPQFTVQRTHNAQSHTTHWWVSRARRYRAVLTKNLESFPLLLLLTASPTA